MGYATIQFDLNKMSREQILSTQTKDKTDLTEIKKEIFFKMKNLAFFSNVCVVFTNCDDCCDSTGNNSKQEEKMRDLFINFVNAELTDLESKLDKLICIFQRRSLNSFSKRLNLSNTHEFCFGKLLQEEKEGYFQRLIQLRLLKGDEELYGLSQYTEEWALDNLIAFGNRLLNALRFNQEICSEKFAKDVTFITNKSKQQGVSFEDLSGMGEVKALIRKTIEAPLIFEELYKNSPIKLSTNLLLYGPSGCGKTEIAKATAQELGLNFISVKGPELLDHCPKEELRVEQCHGSRRESIFVLFGWRGPVGRRFYYCSDRQAGSVGPGSYQARQNRYSRFLRVPEWRRSERVTRKRFG
jgi:hypothetical protein